MNSKKILTAVCLMFTMASNAQWHFGYANNSFTIPVPAVNSPQLRGFDPYTKVFFETGTGHFFIFSTENFLPPYQQHTFSQPWNFTANNGTNIIPVAQIATFYDTIIKPHASSHIILNSMPGINNPVQHLPANSNVKITNAINNAIIPGDTMTLALTYKNSSFNPSSGSCSGYNKSVIAFFYNGSENPGLFSQVPGGPNAISYNFAGVNVPAIRKNAADYELATLSSALMDIISNANSNDNTFSSRLFICVPYVNSGPERNIFLSLVPTTNKFLTENQVTVGGNIKLLLIDYDSLNLNCYNVTSDNQHFQVNRYSRDPNYITTTPSCLGGWSERLGKKIDYQIHFENSGPGNAKDIKVTVTIPHGIGFPVGNIFTCKIGGDDVKVVKEGSINLSESKIKRWCFYNFDKLAGKIIFTITAADLAGTGGRKKVEQVNRTGDISFSLRANAEVNPCMYSTASIEFDSNYAVTDFCLIRPDCKGTKTCPLFDLGKKAMLKKN